MKKIYFLTPVLCFLWLSAAAQPSVKLRTTADSLAYYSGANIAEYIHSIDSTLDLNVLKAGIEDAMRRNEAARQETAVEFIRQYMLIRLPVRKLTESEAFLAQIERQPGVRKTGSGLLYRIDRAGDMSVKALADYDQVRVIYHGTLPEGEVFDSSREKGDTIDFRLKYVIKGFAEGMKLVGKGGKITLWLHPELAYGAQGNNNRIAPNQALVFEVELIDVIPGTREEEAVYDDAEEEYEEDFHE